MTSVFCSNNFIFATECWKCILRGPDFKFFSRNSHLRCSQVAPLPQIFSFSTYSKAFATYLKSCWKPLKCNMFLARHQDDLSSNMITTQHLPSKKTGSCWPVYLSVCSWLRWNSLMKLITSINSFPVFFFFWQVCILFCIALLTCYMYILTAVSPQFFWTFLTVTSLPILFLTFILVFHTLLKYQHKHSFQCVILLLTEPFCRIK